MSADRELIAQIRRELARRADPERALSAQAYMKSAMPFYGVPVPEVRKLTQALCAARAPLEFSAWVDTVLAEEPAEAGRGEQDPVSCELG